MNNEELLIQQAREGNQAAYKALYNANVTALYRFLRQYSLDSHQVEEWVQRAFIKAFHHLASFRGTSRFSTWLFTLALNEMRMDFRSRRHSETLSVESVYDEPYHGEEPVGEFEWQEIMNVWLAQVSDTKRAVFILYEVEGYSHAEIAQILGIRESASRTTLTRTRQFLQQQWNELYSGE